MGNGLITSDTLITIKINSQMISEILLKNKLEFNSVETDNENNKWAIIKILISIKLGRDRKDKHAGGCCRS